MIAIVIVKLITEPMANKPSKDEIYFCRSKQLCKMLRLPVPLRRFIIGPDGAFIRHSIAHPAFCASRYQSVTSVGYINVV